MEFLVHNISHSDLIVELTWLRDDDDAHEPRNGHVPPPSVPRSLLGRPKFSLFQQISQTIMDKVEELRAAPVNSTHLSSSCEGSDSLGESPTNATTQHLHPSMLDIAPEQRRRGRRAPEQQSSGWKARCHDTQSPVGFKLDQCPIPVASLHDFQIRGGSETFQLIATHWKKVAITAVYFPLIALLLPKWVQVLREFKSESSRQLIYLISGAGIPRNEAHSIHGNSTETTAQLIALFVQQYYPQMSVTLVHSGSNIFRFDDNVQFMTRELRPRLEAHRETLVDRCGDAWKAHFHVTIAYTDGPPARLSALNASLRIYKPSYLHLWQLRTFWHERKLSMADVDFHSFENIEASPCVTVTDADAMTQTLVKEMRIFRDQFLQAEGEGEVGNFWLRKSRKPVLAVLLIEKEDAQGVKRLIVHRGMNCEVSMPTGSLCAERNAIGSALASDPTLKRRALKMIGVLSLNLEGGGGSSVQKREETTTSVSTTFADIPHVGKFQISKLKEEATTTETTTLRGDNEEASDLGVTAVARSQAVSATSINVTGASSLFIRSPKRRLEVENSNYQSPRKPKRPRTFSCDDTSVEALLSASESKTDRNPLAPCGACKEWLVKIAEANPAFRVVTFDNSRCRSVYVNQIM
uniref:Uncharacterized protein n=1 Tax=Globisporangium ultimum (strain ATCC 200006 / CBS 805.95 / DAOM BR144) TaxID=431595 RepID=K3X7R0_GLOUD